MQHCTIQYKDQSLVKGVLHCLFTVHSLFSDSFYHTDFLNYFSHFMSVSLYFKKV